MKVNLFVSRDIEEPYADIHTNELTDNITRAMSILESDDSNEMLAVKKGSDIALLEYDDVYMFRVEDKQVKVYTEDSEYLVKKAFSVTYGARNLRREIQKSLEDPISEKIIDSFEYPISSIAITVDNDEIKVDAQGGV
mgnify:CR=1 FL=1